MRVTNPKAPDALTPGLVRALAGVRARRGFDARAHVDAKARLLNGYLSQHKLSSVVVAVSGGIDSAVVLGLVARAKAKPDSPIERIVALLAPVHTEGATGQDDALLRAREVCAACGVPAHVLDLTVAHAALKVTVDDALGIGGEAWASGQLVAYARTPAFYYVTSLLSQTGQPGVIAGTTNRDEGAYLGYVGKAADGMVDVQLIADLHKSEVRAVAAELGLPQSVLDVEPTGDMYDARPDTAVFGAPYDFVELYLAFLCMSEREQHDLLAGFDENDRGQFDALAANLEKLHAYNGHKYLGRSPAVHLNVLASAVPGGWDR